MIESINYNITYKYKDLEDYSNNNNLAINQYGINVIGESFLSLVDNIHTYSFVLVSVSQSDYYYKCIFIF